jgi:demethylmenaquinone methyltransferase/2-methoxy-6-polyprenyl-1,4-benzoquinol methylase
LGIDRTWRRKAVAQLAAYPKGKFLDVATGTGDVALLIAAKFPGSKITGVDIAGKMLDIARKKSVKYGREQQVAFELGDSENLGFPDNSFDAVTVAFGVRNFEDLHKGLAEMHRVVRPGGRAVILEFSRPRGFPFRQVFGLYFKYLLPYFGSLRSKDKRAYHYLYESVQAFPDYERFKVEMTRAGWKDPQYLVLSMGICAIYTADK